MPGSPPVIPATSGTFCPEYSLTNIWFQTFLAAGGEPALFALPLTGLFTQTRQIRQMVAQVLTFMVLFNWTSALSHILTSAVQGTGDSRYPLWVTLAGNILMRLAAGYLLAYWLD